jgi:enolase-phosphatase E1
MKFSGSGILLDIEGTTSSVSFVYDVLFPYAKRELKGYLDRAWGTAPLQRALDWIARDAGHASFQNWLGSVSPEEQRERVLIELNALMARDAKSTGLKQVQGLVWRAGYECGELLAHVYPDVPIALQRWRARGLDLRVYSSGSIDAQRLFFAHTVCGDLTPCFSGHYDTTTGPKQSEESYRAIAAVYGVEASELLFLSDVPAELEAAKNAGWQTGLVIRAGNAQASWQGLTVRSFDEIE